MTRYVIVSLVSGILFGVLDGLINANPLAQRLYAVYQPIAKTSLNPVAGIAIDILYGFVMAGLFLVLYNSLPGEAGLVKGISFALMAMVLASRDVRGYAVDDVRCACGSFALHACRRIGRDAHSGPLVWTGSEAFGVS